MAQAETYICDGKVGTVLNSDKVSESQIDADFLINVTAGFKRTGPNHNYSGECQIEADDEFNAIVCSKFGPAATDLIMMNSESLRFTRTLIFAGSLYAWTGQCSEI